MNMDTDIKNKIRIKLFVGYPLNAEFKLQLNQSSAWKQAKIHPNNSERLTETYYQEKNYLGYFLEEESLTLPELKNMERKINELVHQYCPNLKLEAHKIYIFPQVFVT